MVKLFSAFLLVSASIAVAFGHPHTSLEKRAPPSNLCGAAYAPIAPGSYPALDCVPFVQDPQVQQWLKLVDFTKVPNYPPSNQGACPADISTIPAGRCWWTCQKCDDPSDIVICPKKGTMGLTFDDGPSPDSPRLYDYLAGHQQKATLFVVGSRAISYKATLQRAYKEGHQIAIHTWSHNKMTGLTNEQIVAELKWAEKAIFDVIGVTPIYWRPPQGDVDARVRNIATQLGFKTAIWTQGFDTNDWGIPQGIATPQSVTATFQSMLNNLTALNTGVISLEHDLFPQTVDIAITGILPLAFSNKGLTMEPIAKCIGDAAPYREGPGTFVLGSANNTTGTAKPPVTTTGVKSGTGTGNSAARISINDSLIAFASLLAISIYSILF